jgi:thiamine biosynthesis lipoprotein
MQPSLHRHAFHAMASYCEIVLAGVASEEAARLAALAEAEVRRIEHKYSRYRADSLLSQINAHSGGLFDITSGVLRRVWNFKAARVPETAAVQALLPLIGMDGVIRDGNKVWLRTPGMELDFGGFGKEYAADCAAQVLASAGVRHGYVNLAGDMRVLGPRPDGTPWSIGIRHPRDKERLLASIPVSSGALATSGDYERCFEQDGQRYCHILNPRTGRPARTWQSVSVLAPSALIAGAFTTIAMLLEEEGLPFLRSTGLSFLAVDQSGTLYQESPHA